MESIEEKVFKEIAGRIKDFAPQGSYSNVGRVMRVSDGIAVVNGLSEAKMGEVVVFDGNIKGLVLNLKKDEVGVIVMGDYTQIKEDDEVKATGEILSVNVSEALLGRVVNALVEEVDGLGAIKHSGSKKMMIEKIASGIIYREKVNTPLQTGIKAIDAMTPVGRGQRQLIIGDRNTGKTALAVDTIINQAKRKKSDTSKRVISIYVAIGQKQSKVVQMIDKLDQAGAMENTIAVVANSSDPVAMQYLAPYVGCAIAEYFMEKGEDVLVVYDDLSKHAWAYRQLSLVLRRPSGREAYPGDIFYLHSRLLERACKLNKENGGGSITALPIVETQAQDISAYIPTNIISITDGQIYLESDLFYQGIRPAINVGLSVSRVGGAAQVKAMKQVAGKLRLDVAQYNELAAFSQFGSDMDAVTKSKIDRGERVVEVLKQGQYSPLSLEEQVLQIWFVTKGYLDDVEVENVTDESRKFVEYTLSKLPEIEKVVRSKEGITDEFESKLETVAKKYKGIK